MACAWAFPPNGRPASFSTIKAGRVNLDLICRPQLLLISNNRLAPRIRRWLPTADGNNDALGGWLIDTDAMTARFMDAGIWRRRAGRERISFSDPGKY